ncbi:MAG: hypothetical protein AB7Q01_02320 [Gammaproteobacteria bacterium]
MHKAGDVLRMHDHDTRPILGGSTSVTLSSASVLQSLGVTVAPLGTARIDAESDDPVARFAVTGGTDSRKDDDDVILHQGGGLSLSTGAGSIALADFRIDTGNDAVFADVMVDGKPAGNLQVFDLGPDGSLTLTADAAAVVAKTLDAPAITADVVIGTAEPDTIVSLRGLAGFYRDDHGMAFVASPDTQPVIGGETAVTLTAAATLQSLDVSVSPLGTASIDTDSSDPVARFAITGGTLAPEDTGSILLHQGSGLELADSDSRIGLSDFLIDTQNRVVDANVTLNDMKLGNLPVFDIGADGALLLREAAADLLSKELDAPAITAGLQIGTAAPSPLAWPGKGAIWQGGGCDKGSWDMPVSH